MIDHSATVLDAAPGCADRDRLRAEFDAIIAANFPPPGDGPRSRRPPRPMVGTRTLPPGPATRPCRAAVRGPASTGPNPPPRGRARQRSPPHRIANAGLTSPETR